MAKQTVKPTKVNPLNAMTDEEVDALMTPEERALTDEILQGLEDGTIASAMTPAEYDRHVAIARATRTGETHGTTPRFQDSKRISIRLPMADLRSLQARAVAQGMPYQTLLKSILHQYLMGELIPKDQA